MEVLLENAQSLLQGDGWKLIVMWLIGAVLIYLAIAKDMEPSLLLPIGFGAILMNLPGADLEILHLLYEKGIANELFARVESVLRRTGKTGDRYTVGDVCIDARAMRVTRGGEPILLTPKEFDLLLLFVQNRNIALFRETIYERVWGTEFTGDSRTVDLHVQRLRRKLGWQGKLLTIYKTGYRLEVTD